MRVDKLMSYRVRQLLILILLYLLPLTFYFLLLASYVYGYGGQPGTILSFSASARALGMGNAFIGIADDATATYWNSAGLGLVARKELATLYSALWEQTNYYFIGYAHPTAKGTYGISVIGLQSGGAEKRDTSGKKLGTFGHMQQVVGVSLGQQVYKNFYWGFTGRFMYSAVDIHTKTNLSMDTGILYRINNLMSIGANIQNIVSLKLSEDTDDELPVTLRLGTGYKFLEEKLLVGLDLEKNNGKELINFYSLGIENKINKFLSLRIGRNREEFTAGFGLVFKNMNFDYAIATHYLGPSHRLSLNYKFGKSIAEVVEARRRAEEEMKRIEEERKRLEEEQMKRLEEEAKRKQVEAEFKKYYKAGIANYESGLYEEAMINLSKAKALLPTDKIVEGLCSKLEIVTSIVSKQTAKGKVPDLVRKGVIYYLEDRPDLAVKVISYASSLAPDDFSISRLLARLEKETGIKAEKPPIGLSLVEWKLDEALIQFQKGNYSQAIVLCEEVLVLEPNNVLALKRLGSAYYALGKKEQAEKVWRKALSIAPDKELEELLKKIK